MKPEQAKPVISRTAFWDVDFDKIDFQTDSLLIISKVFNYGLWTDMLEVLRFYGLDRIRQEAVQAAYYKPTALSFLCLILDLSASDFVAYQNRQRTVWE